MKDPIFKVIRLNNELYARAQFERQLRIRFYNPEIDFTDMHDVRFVRSVKQIQKMREIADGAGIWFAAFFEGPSKQRYYITNINHEPTPEYLWYCD